MTYKEGDKVELLMGSFKGGVGFITGFDISSENNGTMYHVFDLTGIADMGWYFGNEMKIHIDPPKKIDRKADVSLFPSDVIPSRQHLGLEISNRSTRTPGLRKVGDIMLDMEKLLFELHIDHDMQHAEVLGLVNYWQLTHVPEQLEEYEDGTHPIFYGPKKKEKNK